MNLMFLLTMAWAMGQPVPQAPPIELPEPSDKQPVVLPAVVEIAAGRMAKIEAKALGPLTIAYYPGIRDKADVVAFDKTIIFVAQEAGIYWIGACTAVDGKVSQPVWVMIKVGIPPPPPPPIPPGPKPPVPPDPPSPAPIPLAGLRVFITYDSKSVATMSNEQKGIIYSTIFRKWLDTMTPIGTDGKHDWRIWQTATIATYEAALWKNAFARPRAQPNWVIISNGVTGYEGPLPASVPDLMDLINKYAK